MASKKGIAVTAIILTAITGLSFLLWIVPQDVKTTFVVSDYENYLDGVKNIHQVLDESIEIEYQSLQMGEISPQDYIAASQITSDQVISQIGEFVTSKPSEEWQSSYISYMDALRSFNSYITETRVLADMIENGDTAGDDEKMNKTIERINMLKSESREFAKNSDLTRPDN